MPVMKPFFRHLFSKEPPPRSPRYFHARTHSGGSIWTGHYPAADDHRTRSRYRDFIALEHDGVVADKIVVHGIKE